MADSYHIIGGQVVPFHGGRKDTNTGAWRDATPLELQLQEQLAEAEREIEALRAENVSLRHHGTLLSNIAYNLAQDDRLPDGMRWALDDARKRWDAALHPTAAQENDDA